MSDYDVKVIPLANIIDPNGAKLELIPVGKKVSDIGILFLPGAAAVLNTPAIGLGAVNLHFGDGPPIPLLMQGQSLHREPPQNDGIYASVPAALGAIFVVLLIGFTHDQPTAVHEAGSAAVRTL
jgi:hypothetical protein